MLDDSRGGTKVGWVFSEETKWRWPLLVPKDAKEQGLLQGCLNRNMILEKSDYRNPMAVDLLRCLTFALVQGFQFSGVYIFCLYKSLARRLKLSKKGRKLDS